MDGWMDGRVLPIKVYEMAPIFLLPFSSKIFNQTCQPTNLSEITQCSGSTFHTLFIIPSFATHIKGRTGELLNTLVIMKKK